MKTAISLPDATFEAADKLAQRLGKSRSELYRLALEDYLRRHSPEEVTARLDEALAAVGPEPDDFRRAASKAALRRTEW